MAENSFYALMPPRSVADRIHRRTIRSRPEYSFTGPARPAELLHVSLHAVRFPGLSPSPVEIAAACDAVSKFRFPCFEVTFDEAMSFNIRDSKLPYVLTGGAGLDRLREFRKELGWTLADQLGLKIITSFTPHLTVLYDAKSIPKHPIAPVKWTATEFVLIRSFVRESRYEIQGRWELSHQARS